MLLVIQKRIHSLPFNFNIINTHDRQTLIYFDVFIREQILLLFSLLSARARRAANFAVGCYLFPLNTSRQVMETCRVFPQQ